LSPHLKNSSSTTVDGIQAIYQKEKEKKRKIGDPCSQFLTTASK